MSIFKSSYPRKVKITREKRRAHRINRGRALKKTGGGAIHFLMAEHARLLWVARQYRQSDTADSHRMFIVHMRAAERVQMAINILEEAYKERYQGQ